MKRHPNSFRFLAVQDGVCKVITMDRRRRRNVITGMSHSTKANCCTMIVRVKLKRQ